MVEHCLGVSGVYALGGHGGGGHWRRGGGAAAAHPQRPGRAGAASQRDEAGALQQLRGLPCDLSVREEGSQRTAMACAVEFGLPAVALQLLEGRADPNARDKSGNTPLMGAVTKGLTQACMHLCICQVHSHVVIGIRHLQLRRCLFLGFVGERLTSFEDDCE